MEQHYCPYCGDPLESANAECTGWCAVERETKQEIKKWHSEPCRGGYYEEHTRFCGCQGGGHVHILLDDKVYTIYPKDEEWRVKILSQLKRFGAKDVVSYYIAKGEPSKGLIGWKDGEPVFEKQEVNKNMMCQRCGGVCPEDMYECPDCMANP